MWQLQQIRDEGFPALRRKTGKVVWGLLAVIPVLLVRLIRPVLWIRFGLLTSQRIGHFVTDAEFYLCEREVGMQNPKAIDIFGFGEAICNAHLKVMCNRVLHIHNFVKHLCRVNRFIPGGSKNDIRIVSSESYGSRDVEGLLQRTKPHLSFTSEEEREGRKALAKMGVPPGAEYVCFHARDSAYLKSSYPKWDFSYHDYRDSDIHKYLPAVQRLGSRGIYALRMGAVVKEKLSARGPKIIDYANHWRTDFLDIYLSAHCRFFLGCGSGIDSVATVFRRPVVYANLVPLEHAPSWGPQDLLIPKKLWLSRERRFLNFREILETGAGQYLDGNQYAKDGIEIVQNTDEEIADVCLEMDDRLRGTWRSTEIEEAMQKRFWALFKSSPLHGQFLARIGATFLRQNRALLE